MFGGRGRDDVGEETTEMLIAGEYTAWRTIGKNPGEYPFAVTIDNEIYMHCKKFFVDTFSI